MATNVKTTVNTGFVPFGGIRVEQGVSQTILWSDGVVLASAWSMVQPEIAGTIYTFRGTVAKGRPYTSLARRWVLRDGDGVFVDSFGTRKDAVERAGSIARLMAIKAVNAARRVYVTGPFCRYCGNRKADHAQPWSRCYGFEAQPRPTCRVCGGSFDPAKSGRSDCCYRHRLDS